MKVLDLSDCDSACNQNLNFALSTSNFDNFLQEIFGKKIRIDLVTSIRPRGSNGLKKQWNLTFLRQMKAWKVTAVQKVVVEKNHLVRCCPQRRIDIEQSRLLRSHIKVTIDRLQVRQQFLVKWRPTG